MSMSALHAASAAPLLAELESIEIAKVIELLKITLEGAASAIGSTPSEFVDRVVTDVSALPLVPLAHPARGGDRRRRAQSVTGRMKVYSFCTMVLWRALCCSG